MMMLTLILLQTPAASNPIIGFLPLILIIGIFYLLVFMPMQRQKKQTQAMLKNLQNGQTVVTSGGIVGTIVTIGDDTLIIRVKPDNIKLQVNRGSVTGLVAEDKKG
ncbi:MAG: preprotein translocase subunit YajC [Bryobacteraceae bacterium]|jgi:preprotein translocase subunit YajC